MFILMHEKAIVTNGDVNICRKQCFWSMLYSLLMKPQDTQWDLLLSWMILCWGHTPYAHRATAPSAKTQAGAPAHATQSTDFMPLAGTHRTGEEKFLTPHALLEQCSLAVLDTHWPAQPGLLVWPKSTFGQVWMRCAFLKQQIHDLHLVDQQLVRELPSNFIVRSLHPPKVFLCLGDLLMGGFYVSSDQIPGVSSEKWTLALWEMDIVLNTTCFTVLFFWHKTMSTWTSTKAHGFCHAEHYRNCPSGSLLSTEIHSYTLDIWTPVYLMHKTS